MNQIVDKCLLAGDKFMPKMHLIQPGFTYSACGTFTRNKAYGKYKDLERRIQSDKILKDKALEIANNPTHDGCQRGLASMVHKVFGKEIKRNWY